mmetsp:Transcript_20143/g.77112  ORF Transcript_20143/g.77112 Transcript_20143/m.77112 type:complete len:361 (+) Transcript_20143:912-1994(+)
MLVRREDGLVRQAQRGNVGAQRPRLAAHLFAALDSSHALEIVYEALRSVKHAEDLLFGTTDEAVSLSLHDDGALLVVAVNLRTSQFAPLHSLLGAPPLSEDAGSLVVTDREQVGPLDIPRAARNGCIVAGNSDLRLPSCSTTGNGLLLQLPEMKRSVVAVAEDGLPVGREESAVEAQRVAAALADAHLVHPHASLAGVRPPYHHRLVHGGGEQAHGLRAAAVLRAHGRMPADGVDPVLVAAEHRVKHNAVALLCHVECKGPLPRRQGLLGRDGGEHAEQLVLLLCLGLLCGVAKAGLQPPQPNVLVLRAGCQQEGTVVALSEAQAADPVFVPLEAPQAPWAHDARALLRNRVKKETEDNL